MNKCKDTSRAYFNKIAGNYTSTYEGQHAKALYTTVLQKLKMIPFSSILDIGCGTGEILSLISTRKGVTISGIDLSPEMTRIAKGKLGEGADIRLGDSEELPWGENSFDVVMCIEVFHHCPHPKEVLREMYRVLKQNGFLIMADPWLPSPARQLFNLFLIPIVRSAHGDVRFYGELEICRLLKECQFKSIAWERTGRYPLPSYVVTARSSR